MGSSTSGSLQGSIVCLLLISMVAAVPEVGTREVVDHVVCFAMQPLSPASEEELLEVLWQLQFACTPDISILSLSTGRLLDWNNRINCTHALFVRYPSWQDMQTYWNHPCKVAIAEEYIVIRFNGEVDVDIGGSVPDTRDAVHRTGKDFEHGVDHFVHIMLKDDASQDEVEEIFHQFDAIEKALGPDVVIQQTRGLNGFPVRPSSDLPHFTLGVAARLASVEAATAYYSHPIYTDILAKAVDSMSYDFPPYVPRRMTVMAM